MEDKTTYWFVWFGVDFIGKIGRGEGNIIVKCIDIPFLLIEATKKIEQLLKKKNFYIKEGTLTIRNFIQVTEEAYNEYQTHCLEK